MAPRVYDYDWSGEINVPCTYCNEPLELKGYNWKNGKTNVLLALRIMSLLVLGVCLVLSTRFKWKRQVGLDRLRHKGYVIAASSAIIYYTLRISDTILHEMSIVTQNSYYITRAFFYLSSKLFELISLGIILRTLCEDTRSNSIRRLVRLHVSVLVILGIFAVIQLGVTTYTIVEWMRNGDYWWMRDILDCRIYTELTYLVLFFLVALYSCAVSGFTFVRERNKATLIMTTVVAPSLFLRSLVVLVCYSLYVDRKLSKIMGRLFSIDGELSNIDGELFGIDNTLPSIDSGLSSIDGMHADAFTEVITTMVIFLSLAFIGCLRPGSKFTSKRKTIG